MNTTTEVTGSGVPTQRARPHPFETDAEMLAIEDEHRDNMERIDRRIAQGQKSIERWLLGWLVMTVVLAGSLWRDHHRNQQVVSSTPAGELLDLRPVARPSGFNPVVQVLQTSTGFFSLTDPLSLAPGVLLFREERESGRLYICDAPRQQCGEIAKPGWLQ